MPLLTNIGAQLRLTWRTLNRFIEDDCASMAAALAYCTAFSLSPLLVIIIAIAGVVLGQEAARGQIDQQMRNLFGMQVAEQVEIMIRHASQRNTEGRIASAIGISALLFAATTAFAQIQNSLNRIWRVAPDPARSEFRSFLAKRVLSFGMVVSTAFLLLISLTLSAALGLVGSRMNDYLPKGLSSPIIQSIEFTLSWLVTTLLFASMFKVLPDAKIDWREVWLGAASTAVLFVLGKFVLSLYLGSSDITTAYGAAGSLAIILLWTYYSSMIFFFGAEFTQVWTNRYSKGTVPEPGAVKVVKKTVIARPSQSS